jgi:hypothetical protein
MSDLTIKADNPDVGVLCEVCQNKFKKGEFLKFVAFISTSEYLVIKPVHEGC